MEKYLLIVSDLNFRSLYKWQS